MHVCIGFLGGGMINGTGLPPNLSPHRDSLNVISNKFLALEQAFAQLQKTTDTIRNRQEQLQVKTVVFENVKLQNEKLLYQSHMLLEWKKNVEMQLGNLNYETVQNIKNRTESEKKWSSIIDDRMMVLQDLSTNLNTQKDNFLKEQLYNRETQNELHSQLKKFETFYSQENAAVCALWSDQGKQIEGLKDSISSLTSNLEDQKLKYSTLVFDVRAVSQVSSENAEKLEIQERELKELKKSFLQLKLDVEMLEEATVSKEHMLPGA